jgi:hypothetical protein
MRKTATTIRCVPRYGLNDTQVRTIELDAPLHAGERDLRHVLEFFFASRGVADAVYDIDVVDYGYFAIINDEAYEYEWGTPLI